MTDHEHESLRKYLATEDERERANRRAESNKQAEVRRAAILYGDSGSPLSPSEHIEYGLFPECRSCFDPLYSCSRSPVIGICQTCLEQSVSKKSIEIHERTRQPAPNPGRAFWPAMGWAVGLVGAAVGFALLCAWGLAELAWWMGGGQ